jgi:hydrogenase nickel incorporation protein HypA/HybF
MHELSIAVSIVEMAEEEADSRRARVEAVYLKMGALSGVSKQALLSCYALACQGTALEGSRLMIEELPVVIFCAECKTEQPITSLQLFSCPQCGTACGDIVQGKELEVVALETVDLNTIGPENKECVPNPV